MSTPRVSHPAASSAPPARLALLGAYRAWAALLIAISHLAVALHHCGADALAGVRAVGRVGGVDFFFVLSGYLIHRTYAHRAGQGPAAVFLRRRLLRIYPLVWVFTLMSLPVYLLAAGHGLGDGREFEGARILRSLLLWPDSLQPILGATWSLRHVAAFYLVFALFLRWPMALRRAVVPWAAVVVLWSVLGLPVPAASEAAFLLSPFNLAFLCGAALSAVAGQRRLGSGAGWIVAGVVLYAFTWATRGEFGPWDAKLPLYVAASAALILGAQARSQRGLVAVPSWLERLGEASFAMIVVNLPVALATGKLLAAAGWLSGAHVWWAVPAMLLAVIVASLLTHRLIEQPLTRWLSARLDRVWPMVGSAPTSLPRRRYGRT